MKPIDAVSKIEFCESCGGALSNQGEGVFSCIQQEGNSQNFTSPCTKEDYLRCPMNPKRKEETKHIINVKNIISNQDDIVKKLNQYYLNQFADKVNEMLKGTDLHLCWYWYGPDDWETIELGLADKDGDGVDPGSVINYKTDPE